ncbi:DUF6483 family protein [Clostridium luticellarii]|jgi:predicted RNA-binding protein with EMAP domain|uniref:Uncharacterized protein n=1 Tax=Clostridium luticellarii TaxID=1691940 RepID=A0A2T0BLM5_9CLOT|nr:DUF6483 family protein [Clostridium luticellarii]MCI1944282.1 DUF6483 family protein [Clostridium luticellarii]MCI1967778.1 DUF6483 family protein [Clostridium luticellarii]MCI1994656.1 DUF6483 family protein [Clostridium luticellarii]MCI2038847.1 DUF6483 family protein [Clostridium luticellarii]PRR84794.1 hypothetical protein CLLU_22590 [Clostridium luticellarii]
MLKRTITAELIKKFNELLIKILDNKKSKNYEEALNLIDAAFKDMFRLSLKFFNSLSVENLMDMVKDKGTINTDKCIIMAKLLEEEGTILEIQNELDYSFYINQKSLHLFLNAYLNSGREDDCELSSYFTDIDSIIGKVCQYKLSYELQNQIIAYHIKSCRYDKAENIVYELLEESNYSTDMINYSIKFYNNLLLKSNSELSAGNLPREEILDSLSSLKANLSSDS